MSLSDRLQADLNAARKAQDKARVMLLGTIISEAKNKRIEVRRDLTDDDIVDVLRKGIKRRRESIEMYDKGNRPELADKEKAEIAIIEEYLPAGASDEEIRGAVQGAIAGGATQLGAIMAAVMPKLKGRADGTRINAIAREELAQQG